MTFQDRVAIVTGGSAGIGFAVAQRLVSAGARVVITGRGQANLDAAVAALGDAALGVIGDVSDGNHRAGAVEAAMSSFGRVDHLVNNVGISLQHGTLADADLDLFRGTYEANVVAPLAMTQLVWKAWMAEHGGSVVNISSLSGLIVFRDQNAYTVTKAAMLALTRQLALDLAPKVRVNAVAPAVTRTDAGREHWEGKEAELAASYPLARIGEPSDIADSVEFLLSERSSWITGHTMLVDGGHILHRP